MKSFILGLIMMLAALWGGAYCMHVLQETDWQRFPAFTTAFFLFVGGFGVAASQWLEF